MADNTTTQSPEEKALRELLLEESSGKGEVSPSPVPAPVAGKEEPPQLVPTTEQKKKTKLLNEISSLRTEFDTLLGKLLHGTAKKEFEEEFKGDKPQAGDTYDQLLDLKVRLNTGCNMLGRLAKKSQEVQKQDLLPATKPPAQVQPATPTEPEWDILPLWARWTIGGVGAVVVVGVVIGAIIAIASI